MKKAKFKPELAILGVIALLAIVGLVMKLSSGGATGKIIIMNGRDDSSRSVSVGGGFRSISDEPSYTPKAGIQWDGSRGISSEPSFTPKPDAIQRDGSRSITSEPEYMPKYSSGMARFRGNTDSNSRGIIIQG